MTTTTLGPLHASDVPDVARLHKESFPGFFLSELGEPFLRQFYRGHLQDPSAVSVVLRNETGRPTGCVVGTTEPAGFYRRLLMRRWLGFALGGARAALARPAALPRLLKAVRYRGGAHSSEAGALLSSICLTPALQGTGEGSRLLKEWEAAVAARGIPRAYLATDAIDNDGVNAFYARHGWSLLETYCTTEGRQMNRYTRELEPA